jgi:hypothetical protein
MVRELLELHARGERVGIRVVGDQVAPAELRRVHAQRASGLVDDALGQRHRNGMADRTVLAGDILVGENDIELRTVVRVPIRASGQVDHLIALDATGARIHRVRPDAGEVIEVEADDVAGLRAGQSHRGGVLARVDVGEE